MNDRFDVMRLRKHIKRGDGLDRISILNETLQVAGKNRRVARHVRNMPGPESDKARHHFLLRAKPRRIEQYEIEVALHYIGKISSDILSTNFQVCQPCGR